MLSRTSQVYVIAANFSSTLFLSILVFHRWSRPSGSGRDSLASVSSTGIWREGAARAGRPRDTGLRPAPSRASYRSALRPGRGAFERAVAVTFRRPGRLAPIQRSASRASGRRADHLQPTEVEVGYIGSSVVRGEERVECAFCSADRFVPDAGGERHAQVRESGPLGVAAGHVEGLLTMSASIGLGDIFTVRCANIPHQWGPIVRSLRLKQVSLTAPRGQPGNHRRSSKCAR